MVVEWIARKIGQYVNAIFERRLTERQNRTPAGMSRHVRLTDYNRTLVYPVGAIVCFGFVGLVVLMLWSGAKWCQPKKGEPARSPAEMAQDQQNGRLMGIGMALAGTAGGCFLTLKTLRSVWYIEFDEAIFVRHPLRLRPRAWDELIELTAFRDPSLRGRQQLRLQFIDGQLIQIAAADAQCNAIIQLAARHAPHLQDTSKPGDNSIV